MEVTVDLWTAAGLEERLQAVVKDGETDFYIQQKFPDGWASDETAP